MAQRPLKKSLTGFEVELFTLNEKGYVNNSSDVILKKAKKDKNITIKKECAEGIIEIASYPSFKIANTMDYLLRELEYITDLAEKNNILLCPLGTYPGRFNPSMRQDRQYRIKESIFGRNRWKIAGR